MKFGELAQQCRCCVETIRYDGGEGLFLQASLTSGNDRHFDAAQLERRQPIRRFRSLDTLKDLEGPSSSGTSEGNATGQHLGGVHGHAVGKSS